MTSKEFEKIISTYKSEVKATRVERPLTEAEIDNITENIDNIPDQYKNAFEMARAGNYGKFEKLPHLLRNYLGAIELKKFREKFGHNSSIEDAAVSKHLENNAMNAALRAGISAEKNADATRAFATALDSHMNKILMKKTMMPPSEVGKANLKTELGDRSGDEAIEKNMAKQLVLAKTMLLMQIGKYDLIDKNDLSGELDAPIYETLVHGSRTNFVLPSGDDSKTVIDAFTGANGGADADIEKRTAASHAVKLRSVNSHGVIGSETKETKTFNPFKVFSNQYGMNIAVGGIGSKGPDGRVVLGKGEAGHVYIRSEKGDAKHCASLLIGVEGSAPGKSNYLGNSHDFRAKSAKQSAFLADKTIVGKKVGGRQVDLSGLSSRELSDLLNEFSEKYVALQRGASIAEVAEKLSKVNDMLMGKYMDVKTLAQFFADLDMTNEKLPEILSNGRRGYVARIDVKEITEEQFKQNIRAQFSEKKACSIAKARFEYAADDLGLAVGAVKELMLTHETRKLGWKILHPIKNSREKKTIASLTKRLETEKGFELKDIASAFVWNEDTFSMNWGNALSNDRDAIKFSKENAHAFKPSEKKSAAVFMKVYNGIRDKLGDVDAAKEETLTMQNDLKEVEACREQIVVAEADELDKGLDKSLEVIPEQPLLENRREL